MSSQAVRRLREFLARTPLFGSFARILLRLYRRTVCARRLKQTAHRSPLRIVIGASGHFDKGWHPTDREYLDLLKPGDWERFFREASVDAILAEHVWEHLTEEDGRIAAGTCFRFLKPGGYLRLAVPDGLHPDLAYQQLVRIGGPDGHLALYDHRSLKALLESAGFQVACLEYFDERGKFHAERWDPAQGKIERSLQFDERNHDGQPHYTSLIVDAVKPRA